ncbi:MAG TPA: hypothetical protein VL752_15270 [Acidisoma sp.]|uniref:hypothetical protein n=1 Tax=Acidisoma sp. TaxID=1872115 RepID=UPI002C0D936A|nr:hypothetical protein [Acidisoma sp.]HTI02310.1 hypothetical protein [Acidisoma sp.]
MRELPLRDPSEVIGGGAGAYAYDGAEPFAALVGRTVVTANDVVGAWAMLYATISGHSLPYVGSLFDRWARESVQRRHLAEMARDFLGKLPHEMEQVDALLERAEELAHERDMLVGQPWSIGHLHAVPIAGDDTGSVRFAMQEDVVLEQGAQFELLLSALRALRADVMELVQDFAQSRDVEKARVLNRSSVLAAELKFGRKAARPKAGPRHKEWVPSLRA